MDVRCFDDVSLFAAEAASSLEADPFSSSVIAVQVDGVVRGIRPRGPKDAFWTVRQGARVVGVAMHTPPFNLFVSRMPAEAAEALADVLAGVRRSLPGVGGEKQTVAAFAHAWQERTGHSSSVTVSMRMYRLGELRAPRGVPGQPRPANDDDVELVGSWLRDFHDEAEPHAPGVDGQKLARQRIGAGQLQLWEDDAEVVAMAAFSNAVAGVSRVGPVYTAPRGRGRGYGSAVTAEATSAAKRGGAAEVVLYTNLSNPTSNAIYQAIGYVADHDAEQRIFQPDR
jgi:predicted GNAT family acetyltransferase